MGVFYSEYTGLVKKLISDGFLFFRFDTGTSIKVSFEINILREMAKY